MTDTIQKTDKGNKILYSFKKMAQSKDTVWGQKDDFSTHKVYLTQGEPIGKDPFNGVILSISGTPGAWYVDTLYNFDKDSPAINYDTMSINGSWRCTNWSKIMDELKVWIKENC